MMCDPSAFSNALHDWSIYIRPFAAVMCSLQWLFCIVCCDKSILVASVSRSLSLQSPSLLERAIRLVGSRVTFGLQFWSVFPVSCHGDWFIHMSSVLNSYFGSKTRDSPMLHTTSIVSWIALAFVGLRELTELASWAKATGWAETCEILEDRLQEVEDELKELREESCFQFRCSWTYTLLLLASLIVAILAVSWCCVRSCTRRTSVVVECDGSQKRGVVPAVRGGGMVR